MFEYFKTYQEIFRMVLIGAILYAVWFFGYENWLALNVTNTGLDWNLNRLLGHETGLWFSLFGYNAEVATFKIYPHLVYLNNEPIISIDTPCNGLPMIYLYCCFIIVYSGSWVRKIGFLISGIFIIHLLNVIRIIVLSYISIYSPDYFNFNHKYLFQIIVYAIIISIWMFFVLYGHNRNNRIFESLKEFFQLKFIWKLNQLI